MTCKMKVLVIGLPILYLTVAVGFGSMYLSNGGENVIEAIVFGARWPMYINIFLG